MGYKEGSVWRLSALFPLCCSGRVLIGLLSQRCNIYFTGGWQSSKDVHSRTLKHTHVYSSAGKSTEKIHWTKTLMNTHSLTCSHKKHAHTFDYKSTILCTWEANLYQRHIYFSSLLIHLLLTKILQIFRYVSNWNLWEGSEQALRFLFQNSSSIFMQINVCFAAMADCSNAILIQLHSVHESFFFLPPMCFSKDTVEVGAFLRNILLCTRIVIWDWGK